MIRYKHIELEWNVGTIGDLTQEAVDVAWLNNCKVTFPFNGIKITVDKNSDVEYIANKALDRVSNKLGDIK